MDPRNLRAYRDALKLSQEEVARRVKQVTEGEISDDRRHILNAEARGTDSIRLIEALSLVYDAPLTELLEANRRTRDAARAAETRAI